jgi:hypothetical protein
MHLRLGQGGVRPKSDLKSKGESTLVLKALWIWKCFCFKSVWKCFCLVPIHGVATAPSLLNWLQIPEGATHQREDTARYSTLFSQSQKLQVISECSASIIEFSASHYFGSNKTIDKIAFGRRSGHFGALLQNQTKTFWLEYPWIPIHNLNWWSHFQCYVIIGMWANYVNISW